MRPFADRRVLLVISGGIAAYKSAFLARRLVEAGAVVDVVMTRAAQRFVGPATFEGITGRPVHRDLWTRPMAHLDLGLQADVAVVAPATAELLSRLARGAADDLATAVLLAADCPVAVCPAMNSRMWEHPATRENVARLEEWGIHQVGPAHGPLAEGEVGPGRMVEPEEILAEVGRLLEPPSHLKDRKVVVTAGPTRAPVDPVRYLGNRSSGRMGFALGAAAWRRGARTVVVAGPVRAPRPPGPLIRGVETAEEMLEVLREELAGASVLLMAAAVADFRVARPSSRKIKKEEAEALELSLVRGPDLLEETAALRKDCLTLGFALETENAVENGRRKLEEKGLDFVAVNEAGATDAGFDTATNRVTLLDRWGNVEELPLLAKEKVADRLLDRIEDRISE